MRRETPRKGAPKPPARMKQAFTRGPRPEKGAAVKPGKKVSFGHGMGGLFGAQTPKKPEMDNFSPKRATVARTRANRMRRLDKKLI